MNFSNDSIDATVDRGVAREPYAAVYHQLQHTVLRLVQAALDNARRGGAPDGVIDHAPRALPVPELRTSSTLSTREREVLRRIAAGDSNKMIARTLGLSPHTVKRHVANILDKIGARSRAQAAAWMLARH